MRDYPDFSKTAILVIGDVMLDRYCWGEVERISPEAPVPVVRIRQRTQTPGGAGNVALNLSGLGCRCFLMGVCGNDRDGDVLISLFDKTNIATRFIRADGRLTTAKTRIIGRGQQLLRMDEEETGPLTQDVYERIYAAFEERVGHVQGVIISDYGKGIFQHDLAQRIIQICRQKQIPVFVDPKGEDWERYQGATCITPNSAEFKLAAPGLTDDELSLSHEAQRVIKQCDLSCLLVTRGPKGMSLFRKDQAVCHIVSEAREIYDVSGAGDTVIAVLALAVGAGMGIEHAARLANLAAGVVVGKMGTQPILEKELERAFYGKVIESVNKIFSPEEAGKFIAQWRNQGQSVVFTNGCFDILHIGHIKLLHAAAMEGDKLVVGLNSDASIKKLKGQLRPVMGEEERSAILSSLKCVDMVVVFSEETPIELIRAFQPDVIVKGGDYSPGTVVGHDIVEKKGGRVVIFPIVEGFSTTRVIEQMIRQKPN
jgi:D-beta-D-heptose 7-phosphate kinase / D-beta-D-heptose 1-phosphate adenosyltransferase